MGEVGCEGGQEVKEGGGIIFRKSDAGCTISNIIENISCQNIIYMDIFHQGQYIFTWIKGTTTDLTFHPLQGQKKRAEMYTS